VIDIPLLYADDRLLAVAVQWIVHDVASQLGEPGILLVRAAPG